MLGCGGRILLRCPWACFAMRCIAGPAGEPPLLVGSTLTQYPKRKNPPSGGFCRFGCGGRI